MTAAAGEAKLVTAPLLCCICQDQNTTLRYEVTYSQHQDRSLTILDVTRAEELRPLTEDSSEQETSASKRSIRRFLITEKAPSRAFFWLKAATTAFTFKTLLRHYDNC